MEEQTGIEPYEETSMSDSFPPQLLGVVVLGAVFLLLPQAVCSGAEEPVRRFDFGTAASPVEPGWLGVHTGLAYDKTRGFGWGVHGPMRDVDKTQANHLERDFCLGYASKGDVAAHFLVDLPRWPLHGGLLCGRHSVLAQRDSHGHSRRWEGVGGILGRGEVGLPRRAVHGA